MTPITPDDALAALHAVVLTPDDLSVTRARAAFAVAARTLGSYDMTESARVARIAIDAHDAHRRSHRAARPIATPTPIAATSLAR